MMITLHENVHRHAASENVQQWYIGESLAKGGESRSQPFPEWHSHSCFLVSYHALIVYEN